MRIVAAHYSSLMTGRPHDVVMFRQCHALAAAAHRVTFLFGRTTRDQGDLFTYYGRDPVAGLDLVQLPILRRRRWPRVSWNAVFYRACLGRVRTLAREGAADLLYLRSAPLAEYLMTRLKSDCPPVVFEVHNLADPEPGSPGAKLSDAESFVFANASALVSTTDTLAGIITRLAHPRRPVVKVPHAADLFDMHPPAAGRTPRSVTYVGQLYPMQGLETALKALAALPDCQLHLVGGPARHVERLTRLACELGVSQRAVFHGHVPPARVASFMARADVLILSARSVGRQPVVAQTKLYEYLAAARPIVAANLPSIAEEVTDGVHALLVRPDDPQALAQGVRRVLDDPALAARLSRAARAKAKAFTWPLRTERLAEVFRSVLD